MAQSYNNFLDFDWSDERWHAYLDSLYPTPTHKQLLKFKKKWYKKHVDPEFDETYEPSSSVGTSSAGGASGSGAAPPPPGGYQHGQYEDDGKWANLGSRTTLCFANYALALGLSIGAAFRVCPAQQALFALVVAFVLEVVSKHGFRFRKEFVQSVLMEDVGCQPLLALAALMQGMHNSIFLVALLPPVLTALLSMAQIAKASSQLPGFVKRALMPLADASARYQLMQLRADVEVFLVFVYIVTGFMGLASPMTALLYGNVMTMRYMMSAWTQASFRKVDEALSSTLGRIPLISTVYSKLKGFLSTFVDPERRAAGSGCQIL